MSEEVLKLAKEMMEKDPSLTEWILTKFPELKESEDERIRKELIDYLKERKSCESYGQYKTVSLSYS